MGMCNGITTLEDSLGVSYKTKHTFTIRSSNFTPCYLPKAVENVCACTIVHRNVYKTLFISAKTWKQSSCPSIGEWISSVVHPENEILFSTKKMSY